MRFGKAAFGLHLIEVTTGATLYLVSACGSAEEFVAAFRRYADRTGLFIPSAAPLPAGRRGRLALTLKDGGVMIEGEAEILQSSSRATVLYGRPGMTVKFTEPDELSKIVIGELEKARLAMRPAPPSVPPRPAEIPAEPRPVVPAIGGRIDAANALAECVVIGDPAQLENTAAPKPVAEAGSGKATFVVPDIPAVGAPRPRTPSTPPELARPKIPSTPPARSKSPTTPPDPASKPVPKPPNLSSRATSIGFPALDKLPALGAKTAVPGAAPRIAPDSPLLKTQSGTGVPPNPTAPMTTPVVAPGDEDATTIGAPPTATPARAGEPSASGPITKLTDPIPTAVPEGGSGPMRAPPRAVVPAGTAAGRANKAGSAKHKATSIGFPALRAPFETQPLKTVPTPGEPGHAPAPPRAKSATRPPNMPRHPTPFVPLPIVRSPARSAPVVEDEQTDINADVPGAPRERRDSAAPAPIGVADTVDSEHADVAAPQVEPQATAQGKPQRSGGMRASEIMAAITTEDWTMSPDASGPTILPSSKPAQAATPDDADSKAATEPTQPATPAKGPPTGNWTISLDPEGGWSEPVKLEPGGGAPNEQPRQPSRGNPVIAVASEKSIPTVEREEKPVDEAKIEVDPTLMEPLQPMPPLDDEPADASETPALAGAPVHGPSTRAGTEPLAGVAALGAELRAPSPPAAALPGVGAIAAAPPSPSTSTPLPGVAPIPATPYPPSPFAAPRASHPDMFAPTAQMGMVGFPQAAPGQSAAVAPVSKRTRILVLGGAAIAAIAAALVLVLATGDDAKSAASATTNQGSAAGSAASEAAATPDEQITITDESTPEDTGESASDGSDDDDDSADDSDDAVAAVEAPTLDATTCRVKVTSIPKGAEILIDHESRGKTPTELELPCGERTRLTLRKARFVNTTRSVTPSANKAKKLTVRLKAPTFTIKVTSSPAGATVKAGGRSMGVTPTKIRLPANKASTIVISKPGYQTSSKKVTPKANNTAHHVTLKRKARR